MSNSSIISTVASEFSLMLDNSELDCYDFNIEIHTKESHEDATHVRLKLEGDGLSVWLNGESYDTVRRDTLEDELYVAIRGLPIVKATIRAINERADRERRCL
jgi:hypothetical protein